MKNNRIKHRRIYPVIWSGIIVLSIYLLVRFTALSFSDKFGQADLSLIDSLFSGLCSRAMEEGSSLVSYTAKGQTQFALRVPYSAGELALAEFTDESTAMTVKAQEYSSLKKENNTEAEEEAVEAMNTGSNAEKLGIYDISDKKLSREYILTNGAVPDDDTVQDTQTDDSQDELQVGYEEGEVYYEETEDSTSSQDHDSVETANTSGVMEYTMAQLKDTDFFVHNFYIVDSSTRITEKLFNAEKLLSTDMVMKQQDNEKPQILIYHTHSQETFADSRPGEEEDTVVGAGEYLAEILEDKYGYNVIHDTTKYDIVNGVLNRNLAYNQAADGLTQILKKNPSIEVLIDLHRDGGAARTVILNGKETAKIMLFNGLSRNQNGPINYLNNPNLKNNLAFSLQLQMKSHELYPGLFLKNYLKSYRFNLHFRPKSLLVELGTDKNTVDQAKNAMVPFAEILDDTLKGK